MKIDKQLGTLVAFGVIMVGLAGVTWWYVDKSVAEAGDYSEVEPGLWMGGHGERPPEGTGAVLNLSKKKDGYQEELEQRGIAYRWEGIEDGEPGPTVEWLGKQVEFIGEARRLGRVVLVHCDNGISRSAMVMEAYLMKQHGWRRVEAEAFLKSKREMVKPNKAFAGVLGEWEKIVMGK